MNLTDKRNVLRRIKAVRKVVADEIRGHVADRNGDKFARGMAAEGFAGGYLQALDDIDGALTHGHPSDHRGYWRTAEQEKKK